jgi:hypothetical protein
MNDSIKIVNIIICYFLVDDEYGQIPKFDSFNFQNSFLNNIINNSIFFIHNHISNKTIYAII